MRGCWRSIVSEHKSASRGTLLTFNRSLHPSSHPLIPHLPHQCERLVHTLHGVAPQRRGVQVEQIPGSGGQQSPRPPGRWS